MWLTHKRINFEVPKLHKQTTSHLHNKELPYLKTMKGPKDQIHKELTNDMNNKIDSKKE